MTWAYFLFPRLMKPLIAGFLQSLGLGNKNMYILSFEGNENPQANALGFFFDLKLRIQY